MAQPNSLAFDPDGGDLDAAETLQEAFGVELADEEIEPLRTVGELYDLILGKVAKQPGGCATSMAFYRLRRVLQPKDQPKLRPDSPLKPLAPGSARAFHRRLVAETGLEIPTMGATMIGLFGYGLFLGSFCAAAVGLFKMEPTLGFWALGGLAFSLLLMRIDPQRLPGDFETVGQLAQAIAAASFQKLAKGGAAVTDQSVWETLTVLLASQSLLPRDQITRDTTLMG